jgi:NitT/TauT family transport system ATP-binding protein/nitrate/nitrite transport system substrate-binding protein
MRMNESIRLGILRLSDAAPVLGAAAQGMFKTHGLEVELLVEPSWTSIADKLSFGLLDGAVMLPPLALACTLGLVGRKTDLVVPMSLSANGNTLTLAARHRAAFEAHGVVTLAAEKRLRLAVVHAFSTQDLLLRYWLTARGVDAKRDVEIIVQAPNEMVGALAAGAIDGYCAGAPWGHVAAGAGLGFIAVNSRDIWTDHPEKCLALRADFVAGDPARVRQLLAALRDATAFCATPSKRAGLAAILAQPDCLDLPAELIATSLAPEEGGPVFNQNFPVPGHAAWFAMQLLRWDKAPDAVLGAASGLYRPDLFVAAGGARPAAREEVFCDR